METYNYRQAFKHPYTLYKVYKFQLPFGIPLFKAVTFLISFFVVFIFRDFIALIDTVAPNGTRLVFLFGIPFGMMWFLTSYKPNGKYMHIFIYEYLIYYFTQKLPKAKYCQDKKIKYSNPVKLDFDFKVARKE
ncbi:MULTISPECIES: conjugal transfer protein [Staphylococcaceae]|uniref:conjugal transfer protein n=1 Tax=Staphylococcaceae TaxID=90964 RepID=UPI00155D898E|nr:MULTISPECIES: conjugal transfer protein [Staphylococcaceae]